MQRFNCKNGDAIQHDLQPQNLGHVLNEPLETPSTRHLFKCDHSWQNIYIDIYYMKYMAHYFTKSIPKLQAVLVYQLLLTARQPCTDIYMYYTKQIHIITIYTYIFHAHDINLFYLVKWQFLHQMQICFVLCSAITAVDSFVSFFPFLCLFDPLFLFSVLLF